MEGRDAMSWWEVEWCWAHDKPQVPWMRVSVFYGDPYSADDQAADRANRNRGSTWRVVLRSKRRPAIVVGVWSTSGAPPEGTEIA